MGSSVARGMHTLSWGMWDLALDQGVGPGPLHWECSLSHWTIREVPTFSFYFAKIQTYSTVARTVK